MTTADAAARREPQRAEDAADGVEEPYRLMLTPEERGAVRLAWLAWLQEDDAMGHDEVAAEAARAAWLLAELEGQAEEGLGPELAAAIAAARARLEQAEERLSRLCGRG